MIRNGIYLLKERKPAPVLEVPVVVAALLLFMVGF